MFDILNTTMYVRSTTDTFLNVCKVIAVFTLVNNVQFEALNNKNI